MITSTHQFPFGSLLSFHRPGKLLVLTPDDCVGLGVPLADLSEHLLHVRLPNTSRKFENDIWHREGGGETDRDTHRERGGDRQRDNERETDGDRDKQQQRQRDRGK